MCFLYWVFKATNLARKLKGYLRYKKESRNQETEVNQKWTQRLQIWWSTKCPLLGKQNNSVSKIEKLKIKVFSDGTYENYVFKSAVGFISGVCLTYLFFTFFVLQLNISITSATIACSIIGVALTLGLAFSTFCRCIVLLMIPQLFSKKGRQALMAYALILVLTGPAKNTLHNARVLSESMVCEQEKLKKALKSVLDMVNKPFIAIKYSLEQIMEKVKGTFIKMKHLVSTLNKSILRLLGVIKTAYNWLNKVAGVCNKKMGTPYARCVQHLEKAVEDCKVKIFDVADEENFKIRFKDKLHYSLHWMCSITYVSNAGCYSVKFIDFICDSFEFISDEIVDMTKKRLQEFGQHVKDIFYVSVEFSHKLEYEGDQSKNVSDILSGIAGEIRKRTGRFLTLIDWMSFAFSFFFLYTLYQTFKYRRNYLNKEWYDNRFITDNLIEIDVRRFQMGKEFLLPLSRYEKQKYIRMNSLMLAQSEKNQLIRTTVYLALGTVKLSIHMLADYSLYWILWMINYHGSFQTGYDAHPQLEVVVDGQGLPSEIFRSIANAFKPENLNIETEDELCLPNPKPPNMSIYKQIVSLICLCWLLSLMEAYGLRLRNFIMGQYYPDAAKKRAVWLYNHINSRRSTFLKQIRRQLRQKYGLNYKYEKMSLINKFKYRCPFLAKLLGLKSPESCLVCGAVKESLVKCVNHDCVGIYCGECYIDLNKMCTICQNPLSYSDYSDISEEVDSSNEDDDDGIFFKNYDHEKVRLLGSTDEDTELDFEYQKKPRGREERRKIANYSNSAIQVKPDKVQVDEVFPKSGLKKLQEENKQKSLLQKKMSSLSELLPRFRRIKVISRDRPQEMISLDEFTDSTSSETSKLIKDCKKPRFRKRKMRKKSHHDTDSDSPLSDPKPIFYSPIKPSENPKNDKKVESQYFRQMTPKPSNTQITHKMFQDETSETE